ncbi:hypothetical protein [Bacillus sp. AFS015802]|uniref:hypothetical protein n=1 Tax=Bacillus sp. AFS015802 TaxID=2033486 RepID=UPI0015CF7640|nr:hypothetical protein [Bacillus sp. AFS015802]
MTWIIVFVSFFILLIFAEEIVYYYLRTKVMENPPKRERHGWKIKAWVYKMKLKLNHSE